MTRRVIWCLGLYASASTWLFNVVRQISAAQGGQVSTRFVSQDLDFRALDREPGVVLIKSHEISSEAAVIGLAQRAAVIFISVRDARDAVASLMQYHGHDFERALKLVEQAGQLCAEFSKDQRSLLFRYEDGFFETPASVRRVAQRLGYAVGEALERQIFEGLNRTAVEAYIARLPRRNGVLQDRVSGDYLDPQTQWHTHHAGRSGEIGRWRKILSAPQAAEVELRCPRI